jgi:membrane-associated phospholipid phosphatase
LLQISAEVLSMKIPVISLLAATLFFLPATSKAQVQDSLSREDSVRLFNTTPPAKESWGRMLLLPSVLVGYGVASLEMKPLRQLNHHVREEVYLENTHKNVSLDNYLQYAPGLMVYGLNMAGIKGLNNFRDRTIIFGMANLIMGSTVSLTKHFTKEWRPDGSNTLSFPSGHTATAFAAAEFMRREYRHLSPWYGVAGYAIAATTGYLRIYNNKHWLGDVAAGAGVGILSTDIAYRLYPAIRKIFTKKQGTASSFILPTYQQGNAGISFLHFFK